MKKGDKNRGDKLFQKIADSDAFQKDLRRMRADFGIPEMGYTTKKEVNAWYGKDKQNLLTSSIADMLSAHKLPDNTWWMQKLTEYVLTSGEINFLPRSVLRESPFAEISDRKISAKENYVDIRFHSGISEAEALEFVSKNWKHIRPSHREGTSKRVRGDDLSGRNREVMRYWAHSKNELEVMHGAKAPKPILVSALLKKEKGITITPENVNRIAYRKKNAKR